MPSDPGGQSAEKTRYVNQPGVPQAQDLASYDGTPDRLVPPERLERVLEISRELASTVDLTPLLQQIVEVAVELTNAEMAGILLLDEQNQELRFRIASQFLDRLADIPVPIEASIAGEAFSTGAPVIAHDVPSDPRHCAVLEQTIQYETRSMLAVPLQFRDRRIGVLEVENKRDASVFTKEDVAILTALAAQATIAIENARLVGTLQETRDSLERQVAARTADLIATVGQLEEEINERLKVEAALRRSEELYRSVVENSHAGVLIADQNRRLIYVNDELCRILGYSAEELEGQEFTAIIDEESRELVLDRYRRRQRGEDVPPRYEFVALRKDGERRILELTASLIEDSNIGVSTVAQVLDITAKKKANAALRRYTDELRSRAEELNAFAYTVAHGLKNPLALVMGYAAVLSEDFRSLPSDQIQRSLNSIDRNARRMNRIIDELLLLSGLRSGEVEMQPLQMGRLARDAQDNLLHIIRRTQAEIIMPDAWPRVVGHAPWVEEVWANYLSNALKYGGHPPRIELGSSPEGNGMARFWVRDNGHGLTLEEQKQLFTPFTRLEEIRAEGHGLGLSIVRRIVERLGGQVSVESAVGQGSTFSFTLPLVDGRPEDGQAAG
ncbi:MAG: PAS domain S-box protein [Anaerolineae bacterium]